MTQPPESVGGSVGESVGVGAGEGSGSIRETKHAKTVTICNSRGLHARASAKFVQCAESFKADVQVTRDGQSVAGTSIMGLMMLAAGPGTRLLIEASGPDAGPALAALTGLVADKFGEDE